MNKWSKSLEAVDKNPDSLELWEACFDAIENSGRLNIDIKQIKEVYDRFLHKFPLFYGYWLKYIELEKQVFKGDVRIILEKAVCSFPNSLDLWTKYLEEMGDCGGNKEHKKYLFKRAIGNCGRQFLSHDLWDSYINFVDDDDERERVISKLARIPLHQHARYFQQCGDTNEIKNFAETQQVVKTRWEYESKLKRDYFHVLQIELEDVDTWNEYLDYMESELDKEEGVVEFVDVVTVYEQCLIVCALYDVFWQRYLRFLISRDFAVNEEEIRNVFRRAALVFVPGSRPWIRHYWSIWEESVGNIDLARDILSTLMRKLKQGTSLHNDALIQRCYFEKRVTGDMRKYIDKSVHSPLMMGLLAQETGDTDLWESAWESGGEKNVNFITMWFDYCVENLDGDELYEKWQRLVKNAGVPLCILNDLSRMYMDQLDSSGDPEAMKRWIEVDKWVNYWTFNNENKQQLKLENGHPGVSVDLYQVLYDKDWDAKAMLFEPMWKEQGVKVPPK